MPDLTVRPLIIGYSIRTNWRSIGESCFENWRPTKRWALDYAEHGSNYAKPSSDIEVEEPTFGHRHRLYFVMILWCSGFLIYDVVNQLWPFVALQILLIAFNIYLSIKRESSYVSNRRTKTHNSDRASSNPSISDPRPGDTTVAGAADDAEPTGPCLEVVTTDVPIIAWKKAHLASDGWFKSLNTDSVYNCGLTKMECNVTSLYFGTRKPDAPRHHMPMPDCSCGFYALKDPSNLRSYLGTVMLEVELSGRVIEHELGYRAEKQRVLSARVGRQCSSELCVDDAELVGITDDGQMAGFCAIHAALTRHDAMCTPCDLETLSAIYGIEMQWADAWSNEQGMGVVG